MKYSKILIKENTVKAMKKIVLLVMIFTGFSGFSQQKTVEESVKTLTDLLINPTEKGLESIAHAELTYGHSGGKIESKAEFMDQLLSKRSDFRKITLSDQTVTITGKTAIVRHILEAETFDGGKPGQVKIRILLVWVKEKNNWKLLARQAVKI